MQLCEPRVHNTLTSRDLTYPNPRVGPGYSKLLTATKDDPDIESLFKSYNQSQVQRPSAFRTKKTGISKGSNTVRTTYKGIQVPSLDS